MEINSFQSTAEHSPCLLVVVARIILLYTRRLLRRRRRRRAHTDGAVRGGGVRANRGSWRPMRRPSPPAITRRATPSRHKTTPPYIYFTYSILCVGVARAPAYLRVYVRACVRASFRARVRGAHTTVRPPVDAATATATATATTRHRHRRHRHRATAGPQQAPPVVARGARAPNNNHPLR